VRRDAAEAFGKRHRPGEAHALDGVAIQRDRALRVREHALEERETAFDHPVERAHREAYPTARGSHSATFGQYDRIAIITSMVITKGAAPMITSSILPRLRRPCTT
jgi:hypothetical protein